MTYPALEELNSRHIPALLKLAESVGWEFSADDWYTFMSAGQAYGHRTDTDTIVSAGIIFCYGGQLASVGKVHVHPAFRGRGLGKEIMSACQASLSDPSIPIMLIATPDGFRLYQPLGYRTIGYVHKYISPGPVKAILPIESSYRLFPLRESDYKEIIEMDRIVMGCDRAAILTARIKQAGEGIVARDISGHIVGFAIKIQQFSMLTLGPVVAPDASVAGAMILQLASGYDGRVRVDVPDHQRALLELLPQWGFEKVAVPPLMVLNADKLSGRREFLFAIAMQALG